MRSLLLISSVIGLAVLLTRFSYSEAKDSAPVISNSTFKNQTDKTILKSCSSFDFPFSAACSDKYINTLTCSENENSEPPVFTLGELKHYLCALEVKLISKEFKKKQPLLTECLSYESAINSSTESQCN